MIRFLIRRTNIVGLVATTAISLFNSMVKTFEWYERKHGNKANNGNVVVKGA